MYIFLIIILIFIIPYLFNYSFLCENNNNHLVNSNTFFSPIALDYHYCGPRKTKNKIKTKLKEKQISHNVKIHCVSPCDSLPPSGEHALSPSSVRGMLFGARQQIRVECGFSLSLRVSLPLWVLGVGETSGSSFSRPAEGLFR